MQVSQLYSLKPKFHLKALTFLRDKGIFCWEALGHVNCTLQSSCENATLSCGTFPVVFY